MTVIDRKKNLKAKIDGLQDEELLAEIEKIIERKLIYELSRDEIAKVHEAKTGYLRGEILSDEEDKEDLNQWFWEQEKILTIK